MIFKPYLTLIYTVLVIAIAATLWFSGVHHGKNIAASACNVERIATLTATNSELVRLKNLAESYAAQVNAANVQRDQANRELARLARGHHPHILCHTTESGGSAVSSIPTEAGPHTTRPGELPKQPEFDPTEPLFEEARRADAIVEGCRDVLNRWPQ